MINDWDLIEFSKADWNLLKFFYFTVCLLLITCRSFYGILITVQFSFHFSFNFSTCGMVGYSPLDIVWLLFDTMMHVYWHKKCFSEINIILEVWFGNYWKEWLFPQFWTLLLIRTKSKFTLIEVVYDFSIFSLN